MVEAQGLLVVGRYENEVKWENLKEMTSWQMELLENVEYGDLVWDWSLKHKDILDGRELEYFDHCTWKVGIVGFKIAKTDRVLKTDRLTLDLLSACSTYRNIFQQGADTFLIARFTD